MKIELTKKEARRLNEILMDNISTMEVYSEEVKNIAGLKELEDEVEFLNRVTHKLID